MTSGQSKLRQIFNQIRRSILQFPPDPSFGFVPKNYKVLRGLVGTSKLGYTIIPLIVFRKFQVLVLLNTYSQFVDAIYDIIKIVPFLLLYLFKYPLKAAQDRLHKDWYREVTVDFITGQKWLTAKLPENDEILNRYNSWMNIAGDLSYAPAYGLGLFSLTLSGFESTLFFLLGILSLVINGYLTGAWLDTNVRVAVRDFVENNDVDTVQDAIDDESLTDIAKTY